jgi:hypothetical protein
MRREGGMLDARCSTQTLRNGSKNNFGAWELTKDDTEQGTLIFANGFRNAALAQISVLKNSLLSVSSVTSVVNPGSDGSYF